MIIALTVLRLLYAKIQERCPLNLEKKLSSTKSDKNGFMDQNSRFINVNFVGYGIWQQLNQEKK
jgi:hypothetical protein